MTLEYLHRNRGIIPGSTSPLAGLTPRMIQQLQQMISDGTTPEWLIGETDVELTEGAAWDISIDLEGEKATFHITVPPGGEAYWRGGTQLASDAEIDTLASGVYASWNGALSTSLGLPTDTPGALQVWVMGTTHTSGGAVQEWVTRPGGTTAPSETWRRYRSGADWTEWARIDIGQVWAGGVIRETEPHVADNLDDAPLGVTVINSPAEVPDLPEWTGGTVLTLPGNTVGTTSTQLLLATATQNMWFRVHRTTSGWSAWQQIGAGGGGTSEIPALDVHVDDETLPNGRYYVNSGSTATLRGLPEVSHGIYDRQRFPGGGLETFDTASVWSAPRTYARHRVAGAYTPWKRTDARSKGLARITLWGSSTPALLAPHLEDALTEYEVSTNSLSSGGERIGQTAARIGASTVTLTVTGGVIPADGTVTVTSTFLDGTPSLLLATEGWLDGIPGVLAGTTDGYTFTRAFPGTAHTLTSGAWVPHVKAPAAMHVLAAGKNNLSGGDASEAPKVVALRDEIVAYWQANDQPFLILGHFANPGWPADHAGRALIDADNLDAATKYPDNFLSMQDVVTDPEVWGFTGIDPTPEDLAQQALGNLPPSLDSSNHLNPAANRYLSWRIAMWLHEKGYVGQGRAPFSRLTTVTYHGDGIYKIAND